MNGLNDKVAIVTGGAGGIGSATVKRLLNEGAKVTIADINLQRATELAEQLGENALPLFLDGGDTASCKEVVDKTFAYFGRVDILHNNHAWLDNNMLEDLNVVDTSFEVWDKTMAINLRGYFAMAKYAVPHMIDQGGGAVINMSSDSGLKSDLLHIAYGVSKAAITMLTQMMATQHGPQGIRTNAIAPGLVVTPIVHEAAPELVGILKRHTPMPYLGEPEDIAGLVAYLASDDARFVNGQIVSCDGGLLSHMPQVSDLSEWTEKNSRAQT